MRTLFKNVSLQKHFEEFGYVKIPLIDKREVHELIQFYNDNSNLSEKKGFHISLDYPNKKNVREASSKIENTLSNKVLDLLDHGKIFTSSYTVKEPGNEYIVPPHQDWTFVDEEQFCSATLWIPLQDVNEDNGALGVIKGSHKLFNHHRSSPSPQSKSPLSEHVFTLFPFIDIINMKAGEALIFNNKLIHASPPNTSKFPRIAIGVGITQVVAPLIHYFKSPNKEVLEKYEVDGNFFYTYNNPFLSDLYDKGKSIDSYPKVETIKRTIPQWSKREMIDKIKKLPDVRINKSLMNKLVHLFDYNKEQDIENKITMEEEKQEQTKKTQQENKHSEQKEWKDPRSFFEKYTISNIIAEIKWRLNGKK